MNEFRILLAGCVAIVFGSGCSTTFVFQGEPGSGVSATETRDVDSFTEIEFLGAGKVNVVCGSPASLKITADDNLLEFFETEVDGDTLIIRSKGSISPRVTPTFEITANQLTRIESSGSGDVNVSEVSEETFEVLLTGSGSIDVSGSSNELSVSLTGSGRVNLAELDVSTAKAKLTGSGSAFIHASKSLDASILGSGSLKYSGDPELTKNITGSGNVRQVKTKAKPKAQVNSQTDDDSDDAEADEGSDDDDDEDA